MRYLNQSKPRLNIKIPPCVYLIRINDQWFTFPSTSMRFTCQVTENIGKCLMSYLAHKPRVLLANFCQETLINGISRIMSLLCHWYYKVLIWWHVLAVVMNRNLPLTYNIYLIAALSNSIINVKKLLIQNMNYVLLHITNLNIINLKQKICHVDISLAIFKYIVKKHKRNLRV